LNNSAILSQNVYNMNEIEVMLSMLGSVKVLVDKDDWQDYRSVYIKCITVTAIECISVDSRSLLLIII